MTLHAFLLAAALILLLAGALLEWPFSRQPRYAAWSHLCGWLGLAAYVASTIYP